MVPGIAFFYGLLTLLYPFAVRRDYPLLAGRDLYERLANKISGRGAAWLLHCIGIGLLAAGVYILMVRS
jgi:hypothetical protein